MNVPPPLNVPQSVQQNPGLVQQLPWHHPSVNQIPGQQSPTLYQYPPPQVQYLSPLYAAQHSTSIPTRMSQFSPQQTLQSTEIYHRSALRDLLGINESQPKRTGEGLLLPVNFTSHIRGHRRDDEEICHTEGGSKLYLSTDGRKIKPETLNQGLFVGANVRILARLIPNVTPELFQYLDYLRQIGDLLVNYTSTSVYCLDHEHRFEVAELNQPWNFINPTLSLNWLKKKDVAVNNTNFSVSKPTGN
jgi:hypothetical protein